MISDIFHISNAVTYLGVIISLTGLYLGLQGAAQPKSVLLCLLLAGLCDLFDGLFARRFSRTPEQKERGVQLDSLADSINFGVLPLVVLYSYGARGWLFLLVGAFYLLTVLSRLAYYNTSVQNTNTSVPVEYFTGLPVTYSALIVPVVVLFLLVFSLPVALPLALVIALIGVFHVLKLPIKKPRGLAYLFFSVLVLVLLPLIWWFA